MCFLNSNIYVGIYVDFTKLIGVSHVPVQLKQEIISTVLKSSFAIYSNRNNAAMINDA